MHCSVLWSQRKPLATLLLLLLLLVAAGCGDTGSTANADSGTDGAVRTVRVLGQLLEDSFAGVERRCTDKGQLRRTTKYSIVCDQGYFALAYTEVGDGKHAGFRWKDVSFGSELLKDLSKAFGLPHKTANNRYTWDFGEHVKLMLSMDQDRTALVFSDGGKRTKGKK